MFINFVNMLEFERNGNYPHEGYFNDLKVMISPR